MNILKPFMALYLMQALPSVAQIGKITQPVRLTVDASRQIATVSKLFNGTNIEDLNNQTNGGIFSQLLRWGRPSKKILMWTFLTFHAKITPRCMSYWTKGGFRT